MSEEWRDIPNWEGFYQASDRGQIKSLARVIDRKGSRPLPISERILRQNLTGPKNNRRLRVNLARDGYIPTKYVHQLVLEAFVGPRPEGMEGCHNDGDPFNNRPGNLRWDTKSSNMQDKVSHGTSPRGERCGTSKLIAAQILEIRASAGAVTQQDLARQFGVSKSNISMIISRKSWAHI